MGLVELTGFKLSCTNSIMALNSFITMNVIQCFASLCQGQDDMVQVRRLSHTMRGKMHSANKKLSMIRSKVITMTVMKVSMLMIPMMFS